MVIHYDRKKNYVINVTLLSRKMDVETNSSKRKKCISFRTRRRLVHDPYISIKCS